jgi:predicted transposase YbfD/YdcC
VTRKKTPIAIEFAIQAFAEVEDPRIDRRKLHPLINVLVMALCGSIAGANGWDELAMFARGQLSFFEEILDVTHGTPSADTFRRVFEVLKPRELEDALRRWAEAMAATFKGEIVAIDGKSLRAAIDHAGTTTPLHILHAWAVGQHLLLGQQRVAGSAGEVNAIPELLQRISIEGATVTTDANGCTKTVTAAVRNAGAHYVLALKGNRGPLHERVKELFDAAEKRRFRGVPAYRTKDEGHGRTELRTVRALPLAGVEGWQDMASAVMIDRSRTAAGKTTTERHFYISSFPPDAARMSHAIRAHWGIENNLHWHLDVAFDEDSRKIRDERSAENFALVARLALMMLKRSPEKLSIALKRKKAGWEPSYLLHLIRGGI